MRVIRLLLVLVVLAALGVGGYFAYRHFFGKSESELLREAQASFDSGTQAVKANDHATAALRFDEAYLQAKQLNERIGKRFESPQGLDDSTVAELNRITAEAFWLRARALRDRAYARAAREGKPLPEGDDSVTGQKFRAIKFIPDGETFNEAVGSIRLAARSLPENLELQEEALRSELFLSNLDPSHIGVFSRNIIARDPTNARARYMLARLEFDQPPDRRQRSHALEALKHLDKLKEGKEYPLWRTAGLEVQIRRWLEGEDRKQGNEQQAREQASKLRSLLLDEKQGALARAARGEGLERMTPYDTDGILDSHLAALALVKEDLSAGKADLKAGGKALDSTLALCDRLSQPAGKDAPPADQAVRAAVAAAAMMQPVFTEENAKDWAPRLAQVQALARRAAENNQGAPAAYAQLAEVLSREAFLAARAGDKDKLAELRKQARAWTDTGLKVAAARKFAPAQVADLHAQAASLKVAEGAKRDALAPHLAVLREVKTSIPMADLIEGALLEREGKLDRAKEKLESARDAAGADLSLRANMVLANVYAALGQPARALHSLGPVEKAFQRLDELPELERAWAAQFTRGRSDLTYTILVMNLDAARQEVVKALRKNPGKPVSLKLVERYETAAEAQLKKLTKLATQTAQERAAREALVRHYLLTGRDDEAKKRLDALFKDYPESAEVLALDVDYLIVQAARKAKGSGKGELGKDVIAAADRRIEQFLKTSREEAGRLYWALWLTRTGRGDKAVTYLEDPANFPSGKNERYQRILALALMGKGDRAAGLQLLKHLPRDPGLDTALIRLAASREEQRTEIEKALARYESNGLFRCWEAALAFGEGKYKEAAQGYLGAVEFTRVRPLAQAGLQRSLLALSHKDPVQCRELTLQLLKDAPQEPAIPLGYAYASLLLDEVGVPGDSWPQKKNMVSALAEWWERAQKTEQSRLVGPLTRAEFWLHAGRADLARTELLRALKQDSQNAGVLMMAIQFALDLRQADLLAEARKHVATLQTVRPDAPETIYLAARVDEAEGHVAEAVKGYEALLQKHPTHQSGQQHLFALLDRQGDKAKLRSVVDRWRKQAPTDLAAAQADVYLLAAAGQTDRAKQTADAFVAERVREAEKQLAARKLPPRTDPKEFEKKQQQALEEVRREAVLEMARAFKRAGKFGEAEARLRPIHERHPTWTEALLLQAEIHLAGKEWEKARDVYAAMLKENSRDYIAGNNLAYVLAVHLGKADEAYEVVQKVRRGPYSKKALPAERLPVEFLDTLGTVYHKLKRENLYPEMRDLFEAATKRHPHDPRMYLYLGYAHAGLGEPDRAAEMFATAVEQAGPKGRSTLSADQREQVIQAAGVAQKQLRGSS